MATNRPPTKSKQNATGTQPVSSTTTSAIPFWDQSIDSNKVFVEYTPAHINNQAGANKNGTQPINPYDKIIIGGFIMPGLLKDGQIDVKTEIRHKTNKTQGKAQNNPLLLAVEPAKLSMTIQVWTEEQWKNTQDILKQIYPQPGSVAPSNTKNTITNSSSGQTIPSISISHPTLDIIYITAITIVGITALKNSDVDGVKEYTIDAIQYLNNTQQSTGIVNGTAGPKPVQKPGNTAASTPPGQGAANTAAAQKSGQASPNNFSPADANQSFNPEP